ncbi:MAG: hypothetical protein MPN21_06115 [Thermoanaerobaculia bacterium]|nr:hypothetical protein [Thermoanaerobaculia bacterium]
MGAGATDLRCRRVQSQAILHFPETLFLLVFLGVVYLQTAAYVLIASFIFHLAARAYWIGLIGLYSIFPDGVGWANVKTGPRLREIYRRQLPETPILIERAGAVCSGIFSFAFSIVIVILSSAFGAGMLFIVGLALQATLFRNTPPHIVFYAILAVVFRPFLGLMTLDKALARKTLAPRLERFLERGLEFYSNFFGSKLVNAIQLTFFSNVRRRYVYPIFYAIFLGSLVLTFARVTIDLGLVEISGYDHFPSEREDVVAQTAFYRDQAPSGDTRAALRPSIQSDVIEGPYAKLFLPHSPRQNDALREICPELEPLRGQSVVRFVGNDSDLDPASVEATRRCLAAQWQVELDDEILDDLQFEFHVRPPMAVRGLLTYLPVRELALGRHLLQLKRYQGAADASAGETAGDEAPEDESSDEDVTTYEIPFWI